VTFVATRHPPFDPLEAFFHWFMGGWRGGVFPSVHDGVANVGGYTGLILYRQPPYQVELWIIPPNTSAPEHAHPNVDIFLVHVTGELSVWVDENLVLGPVQTIPDKDGVTKTNGNFIRILPGQSHRASTGQIGAAFLNVQLWMDGEPRSTASDWKGDALNDDHKKKLDAVNSRKIGEFVKSLRKNSDCSTREPESTSTKGEALARQARRSLAGLTATSLITDGANCSVPEEANFGEASIPAEK